MTINYKIKITIGWTLIKIYIISYELKKNSDRVYKITVPIWFKGSYTKINN